MKTVVAAITSIFSVLTARADKFENLHLKLLGESCLVVITDRNTGEVVSRGSGFSSPSSSDSILTNYHVIDESYRWPQSRALHLVLASDLVEHCKSEPSKNCENLKRGAAFKALRAKKKTREAAVTAVDVVRDIALVQVKGAATEPLVLFNVSPHAEEKKIFDQKPSFLGIGFSDENGRYVFGQINQTDDFVFNFSETPKYYSGIYARSNLYKGDSGSKMVDEMGRLVGMSQSILYKDVGGNEASVNSARNETKDSFFINGHEVNSFLTEFNEGLSGEKSKSEKLASYLGSNFSADNNELALNCDTEETSFICESIKHYLPLATSTLTVEAICTESGNAEFACWKVSELSSIVGGVKRMLSSGNLIRLQLKSNGSLYPVADDTTNGTLNLKPKFKYQQTVDLYWKAQK